MCVHMPQVDVVRREEVLNDFGSVSFSSALLAPLNDPFGIVKRRSVFQRLQPSILKIIRPCLVCESDKLWIRLFDTEPHFGLEWQSLVKFYELPRVLDCEVSHGHGLVVIGHDYVRRCFVRRCFAWCLLREASHPIHDGAQNRFGLLRLALSLVSGLRVSQSFEQIAKGSGKHASVSE